MKCDDAVGLLLPALQGRLAAPERQALGEHAAGCPVCSKELPAIQQTWRVLDEWVDEEPPARLLEAVRKRMTEDEE